MVCFQRIAYLGTGGLFPLVIDTFEVVLQRFNFESADNGSPTMHPQKHSAFHRLPFGACGFWFLLGFRRVSDQLSWYHRGQGEQSVQQSRHHIRQRRDQVNLSENPPI